jgi:hypothetical protein
MYLLDGLLANYVQPTNTHNVIIPSSNILYTEGQGVKNPVDKEN